MMLIVSLPTGTDPARLSQALGEVTAGMHLATRVEPLDETTAVHAQGAPYVLSVYGADRIQRIDDFDLLPRRVR